MTSKSQQKFDSEATATAIAEGMELRIHQVIAAMELLSAGNTIPFIARYRKEATGGLDEIQLRAIEDAVEQSTALAARKETVLRTIDDQDLLTDELRDLIEKCATMHQLEAIYLPYKPKRRTRAMVARERGLQPLADLIVQQLPLAKTKQQILAPFVNVPQGVPDADAALQGALDILAEQWFEDLTTRNWMIQQGLKDGRVSSKVKRGKKDAASKYELYFDHQEPAHRIPAHRLLAMLRGQSEGFLRVELMLDDLQVIADLKSQLVHNRQFEFYQELLETVVDCYERMLMPATESTVLQMLKENADQQAIEVFGKNLSELLMAAPAGQRVTIGIDPGFRTGCKVAVVDETGKYLNHTTIYPTPPKSDTVTAGAALAAMIRKHNVELIAIGNGTASRETDAFVGSLIRSENLPVTKVMVSESGASIYSASELAGKEFPDLDITARGAISIARRLQDPLAELVKSDPKSIGVGQYQHDVNQSQLRKCLQRVVQSCVSTVGVDLNMASVSLLSQVAGIGPSLAESIVDYRDQNGRFTNRGQLTKVPKLGKKAFQQAAGFLRIRGGDIALDNSAVHPESYPIVRQMATKLGVDTKTLVGNPTLSQKLKPEDFVDEQVGIPTVVDIIAELAKPGRDPRSEFRAVHFDDKVKNIDDLKAGMVLEGVITNVTHFGAFVDIGVHQDGLIHISQLADVYVKDPSEIVSVGDVVKVKVLEIDVPRRRISVTRKI